MLPFLFVQMLKFKSVSSIKIVCNYIQALYITKKI
jgi:hypothetical protein